MKTFFAILTWLSIIGAVQAALRTLTELDELCAPIALYPDSLLAVMLPAATDPVQIVLAARFNQAGGDAAQLDNQPWDDSIKTLAHYADLTQWMADNLEWTKAIGDAFRDQPEDVMAALQRLRTRARTVGNLRDTPQQRIVTEQETIRILPAETDVVYVPRYDPDSVYSVMPPSGCAWITFSFCWRIGGRHHYDFDWHRHSVCVYERTPEWRAPIEVVRAWHPNTAPQHPTSVTSQPTTIPRPQTIGTAHRAPATVPAWHPTSETSATSFVIPMHESPRHMVVAPEHTTPALPPTTVQHEYLTRHDYENNRRTVENNERITHQNTPAGFNQTTASRVARSDQHTMRSTAPMTQPGSSLRVQYEIRSASSLQSSPSRPLLITSRFDNGASNTDGHRGDIMSNSNHNGR